MSLHTTIEASLSTAVAQALGDEHAHLLGEGADLKLGPARDPKFGDFQSNLAMALAKQVGAKPRDLAQSIADALPADAPFTAEVAGPGFLNLSLTPEALAARARELLADDSKGVDAMLGAGDRQTVVIDYGSPNLAKEMHIGHLRSSIIGDALARVLRALGHTVVAANHVGDWGTQFGMLLESLIDEGWSADGEQRSIADLNALYQQAKQRFDADEDFAARARARVASLQSGDDASLAIWRQLTDESKRHMYAVYERLGVLIGEDDYRPESDYNDRLDGVCQALEDAGVAVLSEGALCVFLGGDQDADKGALMVRKSDGGYGYATTDLAAVRHRVGDLGGQRLIYVVDARQSEHFKRVFDAAWRATFVPDEVPLEHVAFGTILGKDRKPFKTREGTTVRLVEVLEEAESRAAAVVAEKNPDLPEDERAAIARAVGVGALKYADLKNDRVKDYVFDWDEMLSLQGNTAPYLINAYVRCRAIGRKAEAQGVASMGDPAALVVGDPAERALVLQVDRFGATVQAVAETLKPHLLCTYLHELAVALHKFYEACPVLKDGTDEMTRAGRLALIALVADTLKRGLDLLGIDVVERM